jgi:hypothetical protein
LKKIIFVSGLPRAMTTLMCNVLANNPKIGGGETSPLLEYIYGARANFSTTPEVKAALTDAEMTDSFLQFCKHGMDGYAKEIKRFTLTSHAVGYTMLNFCGGSIPKPK